MYSSIFSNDGVLSLQHNDLLLNKNYSVKAAKPLKVPTTTTNPPTFEDRSKTNLIINYLPQSYDQDDLQSLFEQIGPIRQCKLIKDKITGTSLCYGFVDFVDPNHAALAIQSYHGYETEQKRLRVAYASSGNKKFPDNNNFPQQNTTSKQLAGLDINDVIGWEISASGIPPDKNEQELCKMFNNFGKVLSVKMASKYRAQKLSENDTDKVIIANVIYEDRNAAESAIHCLNGMNVPDTHYVLSVNIVGPVNRESLYNRTPQNVPSSNPSHNNNNNTLLSASRPDFGLSDLTPSLNIKNGFDMSKPRNPLISKSINFPQASQITRPIIRSKCDLQQQTTLTCQFNENNNGYPTVYPSQSTTFQYPTPNTNGPTQNRQLPANLVTSNGHGLFPTQSNGSLSMPSIVQSNGAGYMTKSQKLSVRTQLLPSVPLTNYLHNKGFKAQVFLKLENLQPTGSFKIRGIEDLFNRIVQKCKNQNIHFVCPCPGLNRAITCVYCAHVYQISCTIIVPSHVEAMLMHQIETFLNINLIVSQITIISYGNSYNESFYRAQSLVQELNSSVANNVEKKQNSSGSPTGITSNFAASVIEYRLLNIVDSPEVYSAYDSIVDEIISDLNNEVPNVIVLPIGSGSLTAGIIQGLWNHNLTDVKLVTMEADTSTSKSTCASSINSSSSSTHSSSDHNRQSRSNSFDRPPHKSIISSLTCAPLSMETLQKVLCHPITCFTCSDMEALDCVKRFLNDHGMLVEPAAGVALSAVYHENLVRMRSQNLLVDNSNIVIIVTGGRDVSFDQLVEWDHQFGQISERHLSANSDKHDIKNTSIYEIHSNEINSLTTVNSVVDSLFSTNTPTKHEDLSNGSVTTGNGSDSGLADPELTFTASTTKSVGSNGSNSSQILPIGHNRPQMQRSSHSHHHSSDTESPFDSQYDPTNCCSYKATSTSSSSSNCPPGNSNTGTSSPFSLSTAASSIESSANQCSHNHNDTFHLNNLEQFLNLKNLSEIN